MEYDRLRGHGAARPEVVRRIRLRAIGGHVGVGCEGGADAAARRGFQARDADELGARPATRETFAGAAFARWCKVPRRSAES